MKRADGTKLRRTTPDEIAFICEHWATMSSVEISAAIGVTQTAVKSVASRLKLSKDPETLRAIRARAGGREPLPLSHPRRADTLRRRKTAFGPHLALLIGAKVPAPTAAPGRVHRIYDDEDLPHGR